MHMGLEEIKGIGPATVKKLNAAGIRTLDDLRGVDVERVAKRAKLDPLRLKEWQREAVGLKILDDVKGIGPAAKRKLKQAGVGDLDALARASIHEVAHATRIAEERLRAWQQQAQELLKQTQTTGRSVPRARSARGAARRRP
jgi:predicted flap endonuclease-1-like 5' DNA nuclease